MTWSISLFSIFLLFFIGIAAYRIALEESQEVIDRQMQEMAEFLDKNDLSLRLSTYDPKAEYDETHITQEKNPSAANLKFMCILPKTSKFRLVS